MFISKLSDWLWVVDFTAQATIILVIAAVVDWLFTIRRRPIDSAAVWPACIIALLALPVLALTIPTQANLFRVTSLYASAEPTVGVDVAEAAATESTEPVHEEESTKTNSSTAVTLNENSNFDQKSLTSPGSKPLSSSSWSWLNFTIGLIYLTYLWMSIRFVVSIVCMFSLKKNALITKNEAAIAIYSSQVSQLGISLPQPLLQSDEIRVPMVVGVLRLNVALPTDLIHDTSSESSTHLKAIMIHELTHIKRHDPIWNFLLELVTVLYWFHPLMWFTRRRFADLRERACDDYCIHRLGESKTYCDTLIAIASRLTRPLDSTSSLSLAVIRRPKLAKRIADINSSDGSERFVSSTALRTLLATALMLVAATVASVSTFANPIQDEQTNAEYLASFTAKEKARMAKLLDNDQEEVQDKAAVLKMLAEKNFSNFERIKTWEGTFFLLLATNGRWS